MDISEAEQIREEIESLALKLESDQELKELDPRYAIMASWIDTDLENVSE